MASQLLSAHFLNAFAAMDWFSRNIFFPYFMASALKPVLARGKTQALEGNVECEALIVPTQQTDMLLNEHPDPTQLVWYFLNALGDSHDGRDCDVKLDMSKLDPSPTVVFETARNLGLSCGHCNMPYNLLVHMNVVTTLATGLAGCLT